LFSKSLAPIAGQRERFSFHLPCAIPFHPQGLKANFYQNGARDEENSSITHQIQMRLPHHQQYAMGKVLCQLSPLKLLM
jgi:hypothetical protein